jgi:ATP-dependent DNA helicase RecG
MLTHDQLSSLLIDLESDRVERTTSIGKTDKFGEAICAFANDLSHHRQLGYLLIGVQPMPASCFLAKIPATFYLALMCNI